MEYKEPSYCRLLSEEQREGQLEHLLHPYKYVAKAAVVGGAICGSLGLMALPGIIALVGTIAVPIIHYSGGQIEPIEMGTLLETSLEVGKQAGLVGCIIGILASSFEVEELRRDYNVNNQEN